ncbi:MAG: Tfp pilus assembly protein FimT/FimU [Kofleriaceae bacterium]
MRSTQAGFTLVEMLTVVAIIGVLSVLMVGGITSRPYNANASQISEQLVSTVNFARMRASSTRRVHRVQVQPQDISVWQLSTTGLTMPSTSTWGFVQHVKIPNGVVIWNAEAGAHVSPGSTPSQDGSLTYYIDVRPDGQATASTVYVTDSAQHDKYRVLVYHATGGSYARPAW